MMNGRYDTEQTKLPGLDEAGVVCPTRETEQLLHLLVIDGRSMVLEPPSQPVLIVFSDGSKDGMELDALFHQEHEAIADVLYPALDSQVSAG